MYNKYYVIKWNGELYLEFRSTVEAVKNTYDTLICSGGAAIIYHNNELQVEQYWGMQSDKPDAHHVQGDTKFHIASCRKSYIGFAVAYAVKNGYIDSIDDEVNNYLPVDKRHPLFEGMTIRHLITHSHGLSQVNGEIVREFAPGTSWAYRGVNIDVLSDILKHTTNRSIAEILHEQVFTPLGFTETGWYNTFDETFVEVIRGDRDKHWYTSSNTDGSVMNMYVSVRELAKWGLLHLNKGIVNSKQVIDSEVLELATTFQSPAFTDPNLPENGFLWFVKNSDATRSEIGELVPKGSYQILGYTTVTLLVIPSKNIVAVRAFNSFGNPPGYDYLRDVKDFGNRIMQDLQVKKEGEN